VVLPASKSSGGAYLRGVGQRYLLRGNVGIYGSMTVDVSVVPGELLSEAVKQRLGDVEPKDADCVAVFDTRPFERLRSVVSDCDAPVVACVSVEEASDALEAGADDFLVAGGVEDLRPEVLEARARQVVERKDVSEGGRTFERIDDGFAKLDEDWSISYVNSRAEELLGRSKGELLGENVWDKFPEAVDEAFYDEFHRAVEKGETTSFEAYNETVDEWFEVKAYPLDDGLYLYFNEVTERRRRERELEFRKSLLEAQQEATMNGMHVVDQDGKILSYNDRFVEMWGIPDEVIEKRSDEEALDFVVENRVRNPDGFLEKVEYLYENPRETSVDRVELDDGRVFDRYSGPIVGEDGELYGRLWTFRDITERVEQRERLGELLEHTRQLMRAGSKEEVAEYVVEASAETLGFGVNGVHLVEDETLEPVSVTDETLEVMGELYSSEVGKGLIGESFDKGETRVYEDLTEREKDYDTLESAVVVPIDGYGTLGIGSTEAEAFGSDDVSATEILAENAASAMCRAEREEVLARYETVVENVRDMVYVTDDDGYFTLVTQPLAEHLGYERGELVGELSVSIMDEGEREKAERADRRLGEGGAESVEFETRLVSKDGEKLPVEVEVTSMPEEFGGTVGVVRDISDLMKALESLETERDRFGYLFSNIPDPVLEVELGEEPRVISANPAYLDRFGKVEEGDVVERDEVRALGEGDHSTEVELETEEGRRYYIFQGVRYGSEEAQRGFCLYTDVTERRRKRQHLRVVNRVLRHNLRNSANSIMGSADRICERARERDDDETERLASSIYDSALDLADVSDDSRDIERVMQGASRSRGVDLSDVFEEVHRAYPSVEVDTDAPVIEADDYLREAVEELVANAVEHNPEDTRVRLYATSRNGYVEINVEDDGEGIAEEEARVVGGDEDVSQTQHASGLGLWKVRWTAEAYGGELRFDTDEEGTTTTIRMPRKT